MRRILRLLSPAALSLALFSGPSAALAASEPVTTLPFHLVGNAIVLPVQVASSDTLWFILDTGAAASVVNKPASERLGLKVTGKSEAHGAAGTVPSEQLATFDLKVGAVTVKLDHASTFPLVGLSPRMGHVVDGVLGAELFRRYVVQIEYATSTLRLYEPKTFSYEGTGEVLELTYTSNHPYVQAKLDLADGRRLEGTFVIDTGSNQSVILVPSFVQNAKVDAAVQKTVPVSGFGVGGEIESKIGRIEGLELGKLRLKRPLVTLPPSAGKGNFAAQGNAGNLGGAVLRKFRVTFDYTNDRMILEPTGDLEDPVPFDASGLTLVTAGAAFDTVRVARVIPGSPAAEAGIQAGDGILSIDDVPVGAVGVTRMRERLRQPGETVRLAVSRKDKVWTVPLQLRQII